MADVAVKEVLARDNTSTAGGVGVDEMWLKWVDVWGVFTQVAGGMMWWSSYSFLLQIFFFFFLLNVRLSGNFPAGFVEVCRVASMWSSGSLEGKMVFFVFSW